MEQKISSKQTQMRRCVSCRTNKHKSKFLRIVKFADGKICVDTTGKAQGRGAYVCNSEKCILELKKRRRLDKQFKTQIADEIYDDIVNSFLIK